LAVGALLLSCWAGAWLEGRVYQAYQNRRLNRLIQAGGASNNQGVHAARPDGGLLGRLEIPRLGLSVLVLNGDDAASLVLGAGRLPGSPGAGEPGNLVIAGHRDTFFRPLRDIRKDDRIQVTTPGGSYRYVVEWTAVVGDGDTGVLANTREPSLTLVTCYPFEYIGPAPRRFVVRARLAPAAESLPAQSAPAPETRPSPFVAHRRPTEAADAAAPAPAPEPLATAPDPPAALQSSHGIARLNPVHLFKRIASAAHRPRMSAEVVQALPPAGETANQ